MRTDASEKTEHRLNKKRRFDNSPIGKMGESIEMADVVAFDFEPRAIRGARGQDIFDISKRVLENSIARPLKIWLFPVEFEALIPGQHGVEAEIHRAHVERSDLRLESRSRPDALLDCHSRRATGGYVDDHVRSLL